MLCRLLKIIIIQYQDTLLWIFAVNEIFPYFIICNKGSLISTDIHRNFIIYLPKMPLPPIRFRCDIHHWSVQLAQYNHMPFFNLQCLPCHFIIIRFRYHYYFPFTMHSCPFQWFQNMPFIHCIFIPIYKLCHSIIFLCPIFQYIIIWTVRIIHHCIVYP